MKLIAMTMRQVENTLYPETRDAIDVNWYSFLSACGFLPVLLPNSDAGISLFQRLRSELAGVVLTGGNDLMQYGGDSPSRDAMEREVFRQSRECGLPILGVCRGMQLIIDEYGGRLQALKGHVTAEQDIVFQGENRRVNSYHNWGAVDLPDGLQSCGQSKDGVIKAMVNQDHSVMGIMWHPERLLPFSQEDIQLFNTWFSQ